MYVNGSPVCARPPNKIGEYAELGAVTRDIVKKSEVEFLEACKQRCRHLHYNFHTKYSPQDKRLIIVFCVLSLSQVSMSL